ncbi:MAG: ABC transporter permease [Candidatus Altiarchaeota archaeon]
MIEEYVRMSFRSILHKGVRSWLTMIGIFIGIAAVVSLISLGQGLEDAINEQFEAMGSNIVMVQPGQGMMGGLGSSSTLREHDKRVIEKSRGVNLAGGMISKMARASYGGDNTYTWVSAIPTDESMKIVEDMASVRIAEGRKFRPDDKYRAIITVRILEGKVFDKKVGIGDSIDIEGKQFRVIGSLEAFGNSQDDSSIWIPLETAMELFDTEDYIIIMAQTKGGFEPADVAEEIKKNMRKDRGLKEGEEDFTVQTQEQLMDSVSSILDVVQAVVIGIALISLLVGGIGIMNTMYTAVVERTKEIGVMKAVGARNNDILALFIVESGVLGLAGGLVGIIIGLGLSKTVEYAAAVELGETMIQAHISWQLIGGALAFSFIVGSLSGVLPAQQASHLKPVDALRYE